MTFVFVQIHIRSEFACPVLPVAASRGRCWPCLPPSSWPRWADACWSPTGRRFGRSHRWGNEASRGGRPGPTSRPCDPGEDDLRCFQLGLKAHFCLGSAKQKASLKSCHWHDFWVICTCVIGINSPSKLPCRTKFLVVPMSTVSPLPSAMVRMGPNNSGTCKKTPGQPPNKNITIIYPTSVLILACRGSNEFSLISDSH